MGSGQYTSAVRKQGSSQYYAPEMILFVLCNACLDIVLENSEKAREIYSEVKESCRLPDCQEAWSRLEQKIAKSERLLHAIIEKASGIHKKEAVPKGPAL